MKFNFCYFLLYFECLDANNKLQTKKWKHLPLPRKLSLYIKYEIGGVALQQRTRPDTSRMYE